MDSNTTWRSGVAVTGFVVSLAGLLIILPVFRLLMLLTFATDLGTTPIELLGIPACAAGFVLCLFGPKQGVAAWLSRFGMLFAVIGLLLLAVIAIAMLFFDGGSV